MLRKPLPLALLALLVIAAPAHAVGKLGFAKPVFVDQQIAGGEPLVLADTMHGTLVYSSHNGTTHLYRNGFTAPLDFLSGQRDQVNIWTSKDNGETWNRLNYQGLGFATDPTKNLGFSDPDLTQDAGGRIYNTGINLANDALFSSNDGGITWDRGTIQCHNGDRPWLAGAHKDEVFLATNANEGGHLIFPSTDGGNTCSATGISDSGSSDDGTYQGNGKLYYDKAHDMLFEPITYSGGGEGVGLGVATWKRGDAAFAPHKVVQTTTFAHWPAIAIDAASNIYMVWDTDERKVDTTGGCSGAQTPAPNKIQMAYSTDLGQHWSKPLTVASPPGVRVYWPWVAAGDPGRVSVTWYQTKQIADLDCQPSTSSIMVANIVDATSDSSRSMDGPVDAIGRPIADQQSVCQGGTTCVATGQDRRLGDFFTNALDARGCVLIASGDTTQPDPTTGGPRPISLPIFARQNAGRSLLGNRDCATGKAITERCSDRLAPSLRVGRHATSRKRLTFSGTASDRGCRKAGTASVKGRVGAVQIAVARKSGRRCRFLTEKGGLSPTRSCSRASYLRVRGTTRWSFSKAVSLPAGAYVATIKARDASGNARARRVPFRL